MGDPLIGLREVVAEFRMDSALFRVGDLINPVVQRPTKNMYACEIPKETRNAGGTWHSCGGRLETRYGYWILQDLLEEYTVALTGKIPNWEV